MPSSSVTATTVVMLCLIAGTAGAGVNQWTQLGTAEGGKLFHISVDSGNPGTLYGATFIGVFKSTDHGSTWLRMSVGIPEDNNLTIAAVAVSPVDPSLVLLLSRAGVVFRSTDAGHSWTESSSGITPFTSGYVAGWLRFDPSTPTTVYVGSLSIPMGLHRSTNSGIDWTTITSGLTGSRLLYLEVVPTTPPTLYCVTSETSGGVFTSTDSGTTWSGINGDLPVPGDGDWVLSAAPDAGTPNRLYAVCSVDGEVYRSDNNGTSWTALTSSSPRYSKLWVHPTTGNVYAVGETAIDPWWEHLFVSTDSGVTWTDLTPSHFSPQSLAFDPGDQNRLYASMSGGFHVSEDSGATWTASNTGLHCIDAMAVAFSPSDPSYLYLGSMFDGFLRSDNGGLSFVPIHNGLSMPCAESVAVHPTDPQTVITDSYPTGSFNWSCPCFVDTVTLVRGGHDAEDQTPVPAGVPEADGRSCTGRADTGGACQGVRAYSPGDKELGEAG